MAATITDLRTRRQATPQRWQAALARAFADGLSAYQEASTGLTVVTSGSKPGVCYATDGLTCTCEAATLGADPVCRHRALYWHLQGVLDLDPEPQPPAPAVVPIRPRRSSVVHVIDQCGHEVARSDGQPVRPAA